MKGKAGEEGNWKVVLTRAAIGQLDALDATEQKRIRKYLHERVAGAADPRKVAKYLVETDGLYRFRVGDYRLVAFIGDNEIRILAVGE